MRAILYHYPGFFSMIRLLSQDPLEFLFTVLLLVVALTVHEFAHAWTADRLGDPTARLAGRLTLSPLAHLDPLGSLLLLFVGFGWGKPVPVDPFNLRNPRRDSAVISFAGPASNLLMAVVSSVFFHWMVFTPLFTFPVFWAVLLENFIFYNVLLAVFNLIPVHPLDGFAVFGGLIPEKQYKNWLGLARYGTLFLILLILPVFGNSLVFTLIGPVVQWIVSALLPQPAGGII